MPTFLFVSYYSQNGHRHFYIRDYLIGFYDGDVTAQRWEFESSLFWSSNRRFETVCRSYLHGSGFQRRLNCLTFQYGTDIRCRNVGPRRLDCLTLEVGTNRLRRKIGNYRPTLRNVPEVKRLKLLHVGSLKSQIGFFKEFLFLKCDKAPQGSESKLLELTGFFNLMHRSVTLFG